MDEVFSVTRNILGIKPLVSTMPESILRRRLLELGVSGLVLGFALVAIGVRIMEPMAVTILPLAAMIIGMVLTNVGGALLGVRLARFRTGHQLLLGASGAIAGTIIVGGYLSIVTEMILGPPIVVSGLGLAAVIGIVVASV